MQNVLNIKCRERDVKVILYMTIICWLVIVTTNTVLCLQDLQRNSIEIVQFTCLYHLITMGLTRKYYMIIGIMERNMMNVMKYMIDHSNIGYY